MSGSLLCPNSCGFAKALALEAARDVGHLVKEKRESVTKHRARIQQEQFKKYNGYFQDVHSGFVIEFAKFQRQLPKLRDAVNKWNFRKADEKLRWLNCFSYSSWQKLSLLRKKEHSLSNCRGCAVHNAEVLAFFPLKSAYLKGKAKANPVFSAKQAVSQLRGSTRRVRPLQTDIKNTAQAIYSNVAPSFEATFNVSFAEALTKIPDLNLELKTKNDKRSDRRNQYRKYKENVETQMSETAFLR